MELRNLPWPDDYTFVVAEIGINHNGELDLAKKLIELAVEAGCDAVKFQKRSVHLVYTEEQLNTARTSPWGTTTRDQKLGLEFGYQEYMQLDSFCSTLKIPWFASAWDIPAQEFLEQFDLKFNKVASAMMTHEDFLQTIAAEQRFTFVSTGMSTYAEIDTAVDIFRQKDCPFMLMHTVSEYPCSDEHLNLSLIPELESRYDVPVGYSGHESTVMPSVIAAALGAKAIERHITLDRAMYGSDQAASLAEPGLKSLVSQIRRLPIVLGDGEKVMTTGERETATKLRYWEVEKS